ncbi:MAG: hypothetical protein IT379_15950 [Deltaproteobacteria bacterium]|nr:hypothetical protein [Deltaproteobacteria bacterium]
MSTQDLRSLLDDMLSEVDERRDASTRGERAAAAAIEEEPPPAPKPSDDGAFSDVEELRALDDVSFCKVLAACPRDDLLTVLSGASRGLQRKILTNMSSESVAWLQKNLEYFDEPTRALLAAGQRKMLSVANKLAAAGTIALRAAGESGDAASELLSEEIESLGGAIAELLTLVQRKGVAGLSEVVSGADPFLDHGLKLVVSGTDEAELARALDGKRARLLADYTRRLAVIREGVMALARAESPDSFRKRLGDIR